MAAHRTRPPSKSYQAATSVAYGAGLRVNLLAVEYHHVVFTLPAPIADLAYQNKAEGCGTLKFFVEYAGLADTGAFKAWLAPLHKIEWVVYARKPLAGPAAVLAYLSRYTHRVVISNSRLIAMDERGVSFKWKDYRVKDGAKGKTRHKTMTLAPEEFMRRFLLHMLPSGLHRIRHYGLLANGSRKSSLLLARELLHVPPAVQAAADKGDAGHSGSAPAQVQTPTFICWHCGHAMIILQTFARGQTIRAPPASRRPAQARS